MGVELIGALAASALGAGVNAYNTDQTAKRQDETAAQGIMQQGVRQREADSAVNAEAERLKQSSPDDARNAATAQFMDQLRRSRSQAEGQPDVLGGSRFGADTNAANAKNYDIASRAANVMGRINAPAQQRATEGQGIAQLASDIGGISRNSQGDAFLTNLRERGIRPDAGLSATGDIIGGIGSGIAANAKYKGGSVPLYQPGMKYNPVDLTKGITITG